MGDFLRINKQRYGIAALPPTWGGSGKFPERAYGDVGILWFLAFEKPEDAETWLIITAMEF